jgi:hypothetical protein
MTASAVFLDQALGSKALTFLNLLPPPPSLASRAVAMEHLLSQEVSLFLLIHPTALTSVTQGIAPLAALIQMSALISTTPNLLELLIGKFTCSLAR